MNYYSRNNFLDNAIESIKQYVPSVSIIKREAKAYLVDTSAKVGTYAIPMGIMEASRGLSLEQIIQSRMYYLKALNF